MTGYEVKIAECSRELTGKERIKIKDTTNAIPLDTATQDSENLMFKPDYYAVLAVHNEKSEDKDYKKYVIVDTAGNKYVTGSESFFTAFSSIMDEMSAYDGEDFAIEVYRMPSKNYKGKEFLTCSVV